MHFVSGVMMIVEVLVDTWFCLPRVWTVSNSLLSMKFGNPGIN